jgi:hypothetical protein
VKPSRETAIVAAIYLVAIVGAMALMHGAAVGF